MKMKRANADVEVRGADPDYNTRGGRSAAMDPGTATEPGTDRAGGQKRQGRSRDDEDGRGAPVAKGVPRPHPLIGGPPGVPKGERTRASRIGVKSLPWRTTGRRRCPARMRASSRQLTPAHLPRKSGAARSAVARILGQRRTPRPLRASREHRGALRGQTAPGTPGPRPLARLRWRRGISDKWTGSMGSNPATDHRDPSCSPIAKGTRRQSVARGPMAP